ncbi:trypsin-like peptidase domain-containing protein [Telmatocola sphagniphila]|uniref:Trypsin-like peptidase domain-containing protein n=1 Tax=Telmatocola sphagniphila TaxID=1123043 RepID=A0A8E6B7T9_9BACT|nr:trypsin-like peptidase domain-containing protein [Telmatocola sphagniphila]QVL32000.1 trypsin-like peptidase domain-containing protein [Telmatocola sphagniphila]
MNRLSNHSGNNNGPWAFVALLAIIGLVVVGLWMGGFAHRPNDLGENVKADPRPVTPKGEPDNEEKARIQFFKNAKDCVANVDIFAIQRNVFDSSLIERPYGTGSGIVWDKEGHIVTNLHVIRDALINHLNVRVTLGGTGYQAKLVGLDEDSDLAVLKIDADSDKLKAVPVGTSHDLEVGQTVYAIGNPFGQSLTLTQGIVSALDREIQSQNNRTIHGAIQTDAALNPGNSGGPLFDKDGRLIGVNTAIKTPSGGSVGIGFAIPVDTVNQIVPALISGGRVARASLGIVPVREDITRKVGFEKGVMVQEVRPNSSADKAGILGIRRSEGNDLLFGDIIVGFNGKEIADYAALDTYVRACRVNQSVKVKIIRDGSKEMTLDVVLVGE